MKISVVIITLNEEKNIGRCLDSVQEVADEVIVLDSFSSDNTITIARNKGAVIHQQAFSGYIEQKNKALTYAAHDYVLCLDADEAPDETLKNNILQLKRTDSPEIAYTMNRGTYYCGQLIKHGSWYPDKKLRLFNKRMAHWGGENPHDKVILLRPGAVKHLTGDLLHYSYNSISEHIAQNNKFSSISADTLFDHGKRTSLLKIIFNPWWAFVRSYFVYLGFLDGFYGFVVAINIAHLAFLKHCKLYQKQKTSSQL